MDYYFHNVFNSKQAFYLLKLNTAYIHIFIIRSIYLPINFNIISLQSYDCLLDFTTRLCMHGLFPSIGLRNKQRGRRRKVTREERQERGRRTKIIENRQGRKKTQKIWTRLREIEKSRDAKEARRKYRVMMRGKKVDANEDQKEALHK